MAQTEVAPSTKLNPSALSVADAARLLTAAGGLLVTAEMIQADVDAGAPVNADGTINLVHYTAWLVHQIASGEARPEQSVTANDA